MIIYSKYNSIFFFRGTWQIENIYLRQAIAFKQWKGFRLVRLCFLSAERLQR